MRNTKMTFDLLIRKARGEAHKNLIKFTAECIHC